jgi:hypothetical protein
VTGPRKPVPSAEEPLPHPAPQLDDAPRPLPHFKRRGGAIFQLSAGRAHGISVRPALDGVAGFNVIGMIQLVKAIVVRTSKRSASHQVTPMLRKRDAAQATYPPGRATRGKKMCCASSPRRWREAEPGAGILRNVAARLPVEHRCQHSTVMAPSAAVRSRCPRWTLWQVSKRAVVARQESCSANVVERGFRAGERVTWASNCCARLC